ncbi:MAG TPA: NAD(P)H-hydrate dehydratase [Candidatus Tenderia sp.]|nr:NAD(P)H-hydrate dehydratase [Candidatus Tenderia sp.]
MSLLPYTLYRAADARELDRIAIETAGVSGIQLMNRAGQAVFDELRYRWPDAKRILIFCGGGNNGGDGYVVARLAQAAGLSPILVALGDPAALTGDAALAWQQAREAGLVCTTYYPHLFNGVEVVVDALFGTGLDREVVAEYADLVNAINGSGVPVVAVDIPSGLHADTGRVLGVAVKAALTVTFIALKQGQFTDEGPELCGELVFNGLAVPDSVYAQVPAAAERIDWVKVREVLGQRSRSAHKGRFGYVLVIGGNHGMAGAVRMSAEAAMRTGAGLTSVATRPEHVATMVATLPEEMWHGVEAISDLSEMMTKATVIAIGPGLGHDDWAQALLMMALGSDLPLVVDADALNLLAEYPDGTHSNWVMTPHPGEAARLLGTSTDDINQDRFDAVARLQQHYGGVAVLKGAGSLVCDPGGLIALCSDGNPGMATGGMGDVLTGVIAALVAQGLSLEEAARAGVSLHAAAADRAALAGERGMMATDLMPHLRYLVNS